MTLSALQCISFGLYFPSSQLLSKVLKLPLLQPSRYWLYCHCLFDYPLSPPYFHQLLLHFCYMVIYQRPMLELLSPMAVMLEGLGFNLCVAPFLNVCVPNLPQRVKSRECQRWSELGWRCHTRVGQRGTELGS